MDESDAKPDPVAPRGIERRTVLKGAAWTTPAIMLMTATPAFAATPALAASSDFAFTSASPAVLNADNYTTPVTVSGTGTTGETISISAPGVSSVSANVDALGMWSTGIDLASLQDGTIAITAVAGTIAATQTVVKDTLAPDRTPPATNGAGPEDSGETAGVDGTAADPAIDDSATVSASSDSLGDTPTQSDGQ